MKTIRTKSALICEYLAAGANLKHTLINMYSTGDIIVQEFPAVIPIAFYIEIEVNFDGLHQIEFHVLLGKKLIAKLVAEFEFEVGKLGLVTLPQIPLQLNGPEELKIIAKSSEIKTTTLIRRKLIRGDVPGRPSASPQPSGQSQLAAPDSSSPPLPSPQASPKRRK